MARIKIVDSAQAIGKSRELLTTLQNSIKSLPNLAKALANCPAALQAWMEFDGVLGKGSLDAKLRQEIALAVGQKNGCEYCVSAHTAIGKLSGLTDQQILSSRQGQGTSPKATAAPTTSRESAITRRLFVAARFRLLSIYRTGARAIYLVGQTVSWDFRVPC